MVFSKPDITINGREIKFDLAAVTVAEYRSLRDKKTSIGKEDEVMAKATGIEVEELTSLSVIDYKRLWRAFYKAFTRPLEDDPDNPN